MYELTLKTDGGYVLDSRKVTTDEEAFAFIGKFSLWYFLAIDACDYRDAFVDGNPDKVPDLLLAFTADKATDTDFAHGRRHGLPNGKLAYGKCWYWDSPKGGSKCGLFVSRIEG